MANKYWLGTTDAVYSTAANWAATSGGGAGDGKPGAGDDVFFDGAGDNNCTLDEATAAINSLSVHSAGDPGGIYSATLDFNDWAVNVTGGGDVTFDGSGTVDCGASTITCGGDFDNQHQTTWTRGSSTIVMNGTGKSIIGHASKDIENLTIDGSITLAATTTTKLDVQGNLVVNNGKTFTLSEALQVYGDITNNGTIDGGDVIQIRFGNTSAITNNGTWTVTNTWIGTRGGDYTIGGTGSYGGTVLMELDDASAGTVTFSSNTTFSGNVTFDADAANTLQIINSGNYELTFQGNVTVSETVGTLTWVKGGNGTISLTGTSNQDIDFNGKAVEEIIIDKTAGNVKFTGGVTADFLQATGTGGAHTIDINGQTGIILGGALTFTKSASGPRFETAGASADMQNGKITLGANSVINGYVGSQLDVTNLDFDLAGNTLTATYCDIDNSDITAGDTGDATAGTNTDVTPASSDNWDFGAAGVVIFRRRIEAASCG